MLKAPPPPFPVVESFVRGLQLTAAHARLLAMLSIFPFAVTLATMLALRLMEAKLTMFWLPIVQFPASFVTGLQCVLILRFLLLGEYPTGPEGADRGARNRAAMHGALAYAAVTYFVTGAYAALVKMRGFMAANPEAAAPYAPLAIVALVFMLWAARWFWLHVPLALDWPVDAFFKRVGAWSGSLRIFAIFALCSLLMNLLTGMLRVVVAAIGGTNPPGFIAALDDAVLSAATVALAVLFTAATVPAIRIMTGQKIKDAQA